MRRTRGRFKPLATLVALLALLLRCAQAVCSDLYFTSTYETVYLEDIQEELYAWIDPP